MSLWGIGGSAIIWLAGLQNIPPHLYEAASIDGAGEVAKFRNVTIPMLSATVFFVLINLLSTACSSSRRCSSRAVAVRRVDRPTRSCSSCTTCIARP